MPTLDDVRGVDKQMGREGTTLGYSASRWFIYTIEEIGFFHSPFLMTENV